jgi:hypothetical protein
MRRRLASAVLVVLALTLTLTAAAATIPAGTRVSVRIDRELKSGTDQVGSTFDGVLENAIVVGGRTVAPRGATVHGKVTAAKDSGRLHKPGILTIRLTSINGIAVTTSSVSREGKSHTKSNVTKIGGGAAAGALIGGLAGGGKGAAIGAGVGAGAGTGLAAATGKQQAVFPAEEMLSFTVTSSASSTRRR